MEAKVIITKMDGSEKVVKEFITIKDAQDYFYNWCDEHGYNSRLYNEEAGGRGHDYRIEVLYFVDKAEYEVFEFLSGYFGICRDGGTGCVYGGDSACEDHYNREFIQGVYDRWDGALKDCGKYGYQIETD